MSVSFVGIIYNELSEGIVIWLSPSTRFIFSPDSGLLPSESRTKTVTVKMDDCSKVSIVRADGKEFKPEENTVSILYNPDEESKLTIKPRSWSDMLYKVSVGGKDVSKSGDRFYVELVDKTGDYSFRAADIEYHIEYGVFVTFYRYIVSPKA